MKAIIPVAGSGTRLRPLTHTKPKAVLNVGSKPIIIHIVERLVSIGCSEIVLIISEDGNDIPLSVKEFFPDITVESIVQENRLGLGHAVNLAQDTVGDEDVIIMYGDTIITGDLSGMTDTNADGVIGVKEVEDPRRFGVVNVDNDLITRFVEKPENPQSNLAIVGLNYIKESAVLFQCIQEIIEKNHKTKGEYQLTDALQLMIEKGSTLKYFTIDDWFDCGTPESLLETNRYMLALEGNEAELQDSLVIPPVYIPEDVRISHSIIGPNVSVAQGVDIERSIISDSIIGKGSRVVHTSLADSLIGENAEVIGTVNKLNIGDNSILDVNSG